MATYTGGQLVAKMLKAEGIRHVFTLSGLHIAPIYAGCVRRPRPTSIVRQPINWPTGLRTPSR